MKIEWNKVTWYSWIAAVVVFGGVFLTGIFVGMRMQAAETVIYANMDNSAKSKSLTETITYACDGGKQIQAAYTDVKVHITTTEGKDLVLPQTRSADGGRYANSNESIIFWTKGNGAFMTEGLGNKAVTTYANCTQIAAPIQ